MMNFPANDSLDLISSWPSTTTLELALAAANEVSVDGYFARVLPLMRDGKVAIQLEDDGSEKTADSLWVALDQMVTLRNGECSFRDAQGGEHNAILTKKRRLTEADVLATSTLLGQAFSLTSNNTK